MGFIVKVSELDIGDLFETADGEYSGIIHSEYFDAMDEACKAIEELGDRVSNVLIEEVDYVR
jgi:hypothetical protein